LGGKNSKDTPSFCCENSSLIFISIHLLVVIVCHVEGRALSDNKKLCRLASYLHGNIVLCWVKKYPFPRTFQPVI
jgi:hypothetical protein